VGKQVIRGPVIWKLLGISQVAREVQPGIVSTKSAATHVCSQP